MDDLIEPQPKRFKHQSYNRQLKEVHLPSAFHQSTYENEIGENNSHFHEGLEHWRQLNLAPSFITFANKADGLSASMPLLLHHWKEIVELWIGALEASDDEALRALLDLLQKMAHDLRTTLSPVYLDLLDRLLQLLSRSISPAALTVLLETFSSLFRFLLVPSIHLNLLEETWSSIKSSLPKCLPEIQRAMAEVWGSVLRKFKSAAREKAVTLLAEGVDQFDDASAWVLVYACKSVSQTLHTATVSIFAPLLNYHLSCADPSRTYTLIRRALTALIHHVKNADQFSSLGNLLIQQLKSTTNSLISSDEQIRRMLEVIAVACSVRQGSRLTDAQKMSLFADLDSLRIKPATSSSLLIYTTALFTSAEMSIWLGPGLKFLQRSWGLIEPNGNANDTVDDTESSLDLAIQLNGSLAELGWGGWKLVALPLILKSTVKPQLIEKEPRKMIAFLAGLKRLKKLNTGETDLVWRSRIEKCALDRLRVLKFEDGEGAVTELSDILVLSSFFSNSVSPLLLDITNRILNTSCTPGSSESAAWTLSMCMQALSKRNKDEWASKVDLSSWARISTQRWAWSHDVLGALVDLSQVSHSQSTPIPFSRGYADLQSSILSHSRPLRLAALRLLDSNLVDASGGAEEVLKRCLQGEEASLDLQGVRERVLRIGRVVPVVGDSEGADLCARWLIAQLKVNLRPLWSPAAAALASLSQRFGDLVWKLLFAELQTVSGAPGQGNARVTEDGQHDTEAVNEDDNWEEERSWRDPSAHKVRGIVFHWADTDFSRKELVNEYQIQERFDLVSYEYQLLTTLGELSSLAEKHNRDLIPYFLSIIDSNVISTTPNAKSKLSKQKLIAWLTLFSKFTNPRALHSTETLKNLYTTYLSHPDRPLQRIALSCLLTYKSPHLSPHEDRLKGLLDDTRWRDELTTLDIVNLEPQDRDEVVNVLLRLLFGLMLEKKGRSRGADRRAAVLSALAGCSDAELGLLVDLMLQPLGLDRTSHQNAADGFEVFVLSSGVGEKQVVGFLTLLGDVMKNLGSRLTAFWPALLGTTIDLTSYAQSRIGDTGQVNEAEDTVDDLDDVVDVDNNNDNDSNGIDEHLSHSQLTPSTSSSPKILRSIRQLGLKRFADFFRSPVSFDFKPYLASSFERFISPRLPTLDSENIQSPSALLELFYVWTLDPEHTTSLVEYDGQVLPQIYRCLVATNVKPIVISRIFDILEKLLGHAEEEELIREKVLKPHVSLLLTSISTLFERTKGGGPSLPSKLASKSKSASLVMSMSVSTPLGQRQITILSAIAQYSTSPSQATTLLSLFLPLLRKPNKLVPEKVKTNLIKIIGELVHLVPEFRSPANSAFCPTPGFRDSSNKAGIWQHTYGLLSGLFQTLRSRGARLSLVGAFQQLADAASADGEGPSWLPELSSLLASMNAYSQKRIDEPDFDQRLTAYSNLNEQLYASISPVAWIPIIYNSLYCVQDQEELAIRNSAGYALRRFVDLVVKSTLGSSSFDSPSAYTAVFLTTFLPSLKSLLSTPLVATSNSSIHTHTTSTLPIKSDLLSLLAYCIVQLPPTLSPSLAALHPLLENGDEEKSFFGNVLHVQIHRRIRAVRRLGERCEKGEWDVEESSASVVKEWLIPIVGWFLGSGSTSSSFHNNHVNKGGNRTKESNNKVDHQHHLTNESIITMGKLARYLEWGAYYTLVQRYLKLAKLKDEHEKVYVRTVVAILENWHFDVVDVEDQKKKEEELESMDVDSGKDEGQEGEVEVLDADLEDKGYDDDDGEEETGGAGDADGPSTSATEAPVLPHNLSTKSKRVPQIHLTLTMRLLPSLLLFLSPPPSAMPSQAQEDTPISTRIPLALPIAHLSLILPATNRDQRAKKVLQVTRLLTVLSQMMKSRSQEVRDAVRDVLGKVAIVLVEEVARKEDMNEDEEDYLKILIGELRAALLRGPQIHVLACVVNSIITKITSGFEDGKRGVVTKSEGDDEVRDQEGAITTESKTVRQGTMHQPYVLDTVITDIADIASTILFSEPSMASTDDSSSVDASLNASTLAHLKSPFSSPTFREPRQAPSASLSLFALGAQYSRPKMLGTLLGPVKGVMGETGNLKVMGVVDEVLRRVTGGLEKNGVLERANEGGTKEDDGDWLLSVVWGLVSGNVRFLKEREKSGKGKKGKGKKGTKEGKASQGKQKEKVDDRLVQVKRQVEKDNDHYAHNSFRFIVLGLDLLHTSLRRGRYSSSSPSTTLNQLNSILSLLGSSLYSTSTPVLLLALKSVTLLVTKHPRLSSVGRYLPVYVDQILEIIKQGGGSTEGELMQVALKSLGVIIRDGPKPNGHHGGPSFGVEIKEKDLVYLLELVTPDLEEPERQSTAYTLLRALISRKFILPQIYDLMSPSSSSSPSASPSVSHLLITSQSPNTRSQSRALLLQFLLDYPQGKGRLSNTLSFLLRNLTSYPHASGRTSILELLGAVVEKFNVALVKEFGEMIFVALVMVIANDDAPKCREMAGWLLSALYGRLGGSTESGNGPDDSQDSEQRQVVRGHLRAWMVSAAAAGRTERDKVKLGWVAAQAWGFVVDSYAKKLEKEGDGVPLTAVWVAEIVQDMTTALKNSKDRMDVILNGEAGSEDNEDNMDVDTDGDLALGWQLPYYTMTTLSKLARVLPGLVKLDLQGQLNVPMKTQHQQKDANASIPWTLVSSHLLFPHAWVRTAASRLLGQMFAANPPFEPSKAIPSITSKPSTTDTATSPNTQAWLREVAGDLCEQLKSDHLESVLGMQIVKNLVWVAKCFCLEDWDSRGGVSGRQDYRRADSNAVGEIAVLVGEDEIEDEEGGAMRKLKGSKRRKADSGQQDNLDTLPWLFSKLSYQIRSAHIKRRSRASKNPNWSQQPLAALRWFAAMTTHMDTQKLERFLIHILTPLYRISEDDTITDEQMDELKSTSLELLDLIQQKVSPTAFSLVYNQIRQRVLEVRRERKTQRVLVEVVDPEKAARRKEKRNLGKRESRKRKDGAFGEARGKIKRRREL